MSQLKVDTITDEEGTGSPAFPNGADITGGTASLDANGLTVGTDQLVTSGGNVGIGTSSPTERLEVQTPSGVNCLVKATKVGTDSIQMGVDSGPYINGGANLSFKVSDTERMRINSSGNVFVGNPSSFDGNIYKMELFGGNNRCLLTRVNGTAGQIQCVFQNDNGTVGTIVTTGSSTTYNTSSDYRLKEDLQPVEDPIGRLKQLKPFNFAWKVDGTRVDGFLAHEAQEVVPEAVTGTKDAMRTEEYEVSPAVLDEDGNVFEEAVMGEREVPEYQGIDQAKLVPLLTAALQDAVAKIESLEQRIQALEGKE